MTALASFFCSSVAAFAPIGIDASSAANATAPTITFLTLTLLKLFGGRDVATRDCIVRKLFLETRIDLACKHADAMDGIVVIEMTCLAHEQQVPEAADMVIEGLDLLEDLVRRAVEHRAVGDSAFDGRIGAEIAKAAAGGVAQHHLHVRGDRAVARRIAEPGRDLVRRDVPEELFGTGARLGL